MRCGWNPIHILAPSEQPHSFVNYQMIAHPNGPVSTQAPWQAFPLGGEARKEALEALHAIAHSLPGPSAQGFGPSLSGGHAGFALFHAYYSLSGLDGHDHRGLSSAHLEAAAERISDIGGFSGLFGGYTGTAWTVDHLENLSIIESDQDLNEDIDAELIAHLAQRPYIGLCELIAGISGLGLYGLDRATRGKGRQVAQAALDALLATSVRDGGFTTWFNAPEALHPLALETTPNGCFNLGLSHGVPGAIGFLAEAAAAGFEQARPLLNGAMGWLLAQRKDYPNGSRYGYSISDGNEKAHGSRISWCYGDLGLAAVILLAARLEGRLDWEEAAMDLGHHCAARPLEGSGIVDAGLCHGSIGNAHIFHRLWQATHDPAFEVAATGWLEHGLAMRKPEEPFGGFLAWHAQPPDYKDASYVPDPSLLEGTAGIGLALLAFLSPHEPNWDRHMLVHVPPRA